MTTSQYDTRQSELASIETRDSKQSNKQITSKQINKHQTNTIPTNNKQRNKQVTNQEANKIKRQESYKQQIIEQTNMQQQTPNSRTKQFMRKLSSKTIQQSKQTKQNQQVTAIHLRTRMMRLPISLKRGCLFRRPYNWLQLSRPLT
jgi:hypothetical protein